MTPHVAKRHLRGTCRCPPTNSFVSVSIVTLMTNVTYIQRRPENTVLHQVIRQNFSKFKSLMNDKEKSIPGYVLKEFEEYLSCGDPTKGFARLRCSDCGHEKLLPFSCKRRGFCPSCWGRRMVEAEIHLVDEVFPEQNTRQWVLSLPVPLRIYCSRNRKLINLLLRIFYETILSLIRKKLRSIGINKTQGGGVIFIQRLGGALNLNIHFHSIFLDGAYTEEADGSFKFHNIADLLTPEDIGWAVERIARRSISALKKLGLLENEDIDLESDPNTGILNCDNASIKNLILLGERSGEKVRRLRLLCKDEVPKLNGDNVASMHGFNLKADTLVKAHQRWKLARLVRYVARPPVSNERLKISDDGSTVRYVMKRPWSDGTYEIVFSGVELVEKLASSVPPPRGHLIRYAGVLAPNSAVRSKVVLKPKPKVRSEDGKKTTTEPQRRAWAELAKRSFGIDLTVCEKCSGAVKRIAIIKDPAVNLKILRCVAADREIPAASDDQLLTKSSIWSQAPPPMEPYYDTIPA